MIRSLKAAALAAAVTLASAAPAAAEVTLINVFEVPAGKEDAVIAAWETARDFLRQEPGYVSTALHQAVTPDARFALINVAVWESAEAFRRATARMQAAGVFPEIEGLRFTPALYRVIRSDEAQQ
jgi:heme-degrading monooxygenase HmoA